MTRAEGGITVHFQNGDVLVPDALIKTSTLRSAEENDRAWTEDEKARIAKGQVFFEGSWMSARRRDRLRTERREERAAKIERVKRAQKWANHEVATTKNFEFHYTIDPDQMEELMEMMEVYYKTFTKEWRIKKPRGLGRLKVNFFHDGEYFQQVTGMPPGVLGFFRFVQPIELCFYFERLDPELTVDVMFHEANHYLTYLIDPEFRYPSWVNESLAEYYGASVWDSKKKRMLLGDLQEGRVAVLQDALKADKLLGLEEMMRIERFSAVHYAWGWSFVHYLLSSERYAKRFKAFYLALAKDKDVERTRFFRDMKQVGPDEQIRVFKKYMKIDDLKDLEEEWHDYVRSLQPAGPRGVFRAGQIAYMYGMPIKAQRLLKEALKRGSQDPRCHSILGRALLQRKKTEEAEKHFRLALELDPLDAETYLDLARIVSRKPNQAAEARRLRALALEIDPDNYLLRLRSQALSGL